MWLSAVAHVRHAYTDYDDLIADGYPTEAARHFVLDAMNDVLRNWGAKRLITAEAEDWLP